MALLDHEPTGLEGSCVIMILPLPLVPLAPVALPLMLLGSVYGTEHGQHITANGEHYTGKSITCALRSKPHNEYYLVEYHGRHIYCRHNDWGPARWTHKSIDLSTASAAKLGFRGGAVRVSKDRRKAK